MINLLKINIDENPTITQILEITTIPTLFIFKNGYLLDKDIEINEFPFVKKGIIAGFTCEHVIEEIIKFCE